MKEHDGKHSLLPYLLHPGGGISLRPSLISQDTAVLGKASFPFLIVSESDPLARLIEAQFVTDAESDIRKVFLFVQRDQYLITKDDLRPVNNKDVEGSWQKAFSFYTHGNQNGPLMILSNQINEKGELALMSPLFFCNTRQSYFHPPCPKCGLSLQQCEDDNLLISAGLQSYTQSLKRYLFCPSCYASGKQDFYGYESDRFDPPSVKDRWALIKEFAQLPKKAYADTQFPCGECPYHQECYGLNGKAASRIIPFSFYPFSLLLFQAMSLNAIDFLSLVSGAPFEEVEAPLRVKQELGRANCLKAIRQNCFNTAPVLFDHDERRFLEILYLKLSFLAGFLQNVRSENKLAVPADTRFSLDRIWIKLADQGGFLPFFWNFTVTYLDISSRLTETASLPKSPSSDGLFSLGLFWFYTFLVNKKQDISKIYPSLSAAMDQRFADNDASCEKRYGEELCAQFPPENIFWDPEGKQVKKDWQSLWERTLQLGWSLLMTAFRNMTTAWSEGFFQELEQVREEIRRNLFNEQKGRYSGTAGGSPEMLPEMQEAEKTGSISASGSFPEQAPIEQDQGFSVADKTIYGILMKIIRKRSAEFGKEVSDPDKTVTLILKDLKKETAVEKDKDKEARDIIPETVLLPSGKGKKDAKQSANREELDETVILSLKGFQKERPPEKIEKSGNLVPETVIISARETDKRPLQTPLKVMASDSHGNKKDVIPKGNDPLELDKNKAKRINEADFIAETVILKPEKVKYKNGRKE